MPKRGEIKKSTLVRSQAILSLLKSRGEMHLRGIASALKLNPATVYRILNSYLEPFVESRDVELLGFRAKLIKLKPGKENITIDDIISYIDLKRRIKHS